VAPSATQSKFIRAAEGVAKPNKSAPVDLKALLVSIHLAILNRAKTAEILRSMYSAPGRAEVHPHRTAWQFARILEQCRMKARSLEGVRQEKLMRTQELVSSFRCARRSSFAAPDKRCSIAARDRKRNAVPDSPLAARELPSDIYRLFLNPLIFSEDGSDDYLCAEHYYMFGNFEKDPDRFPIFRRLALSFLRELDTGKRWTMSIWNRR